MFRGGKGGRLRIFLGFLGLGQYIVEGALGGLGLGLVDDSYK